MRPYTQLSQEDAERLFALVHPDPHSILGAHPVAEGLVVRALRPEAERVEVVIENEGPREMVRVHPGGIFEALIAGRGDVPRYELRTSYPGGNVFTLRDPYGFPPTLGSIDEHLFGEGRHDRIYDKLGSHVRKVNDVDGVSFAVWAPQAEGVSVVGDFNNWDGRLHQMRRLGVSGIWELFIPGLGPGAVYKYEIHHRGTPRFLKADPYAFYAEVPPATSSIVYESAYEFQDAAWIEQRAAADFLHRPLSIYEVHLGSWRHVIEEQNRSLTYRETAAALADYVLEMGFTHVEFLPLKGHPYGGSWGYQVANYYAPTARYGTPDDFRFLVDHLHQRGIGVIMDWVPAHFPKDAWALGRFDGSALYEHLDERLGEHPDWGTYIYNYGRNEVCNFLVANALYWIDEFHIDGLRVDAVASMLYLDYSRADGRWVQNRYGGRENLDAIEFLRELNTVAHSLHPGVMIIAEESTSWPLVSRPVEDGGLGFDFKWNMGWMHDTLQYFAKDSLYRQYFHNCLTFGFLYAWSENFILPLSHDEVVHMKGSMINKMHGERWQKFANLRSLYGYMWAHPGKKLLFMGGEIGQWREWNNEQSLDWHLLDEPEHKGVQLLIQDLNRLYAEHAELSESDVDPAGFQWLEANDAQGNTAAFLRKSKTTERQVVCVCNFSPVVRHDYRVGLPLPGEYRQILNTDAARYGGGNSGSVAAITAEQLPWHGQPLSAALTLPPLSTVWLEGPHTQDQPK
ncbi:MAG TPA: 1,4-alpha-glucan branching protein GlgB [Pyrinomonadaceae bacterium]|nr:1,4-alpha-glucan branching protein GlgB [Pyrinomonadaceae bacterium]